MSAPSSGTTARAWEILAGVADPEIPVISVVDLGIVRNVREEGGALEVTVTPTYSGCPATQVIEASIRRALADELLFGRLAGGGKVTIDIGDDDKVALRFLEAPEPVAPATET